MLYKIINPSDAYTMQADEDKVAIAACLLLGDGQYGLRRENDEIVCPVLAFGGDSVTKWLTDTFGMDLGEYVKQHKREVALALDTVVIGDFEDRKQPTRDKVAFDIGSRARALSCNMQGVPVSVPAVAPVLVSG